MNPQAIQATADKHRKAIDTALDVAVSGGWIETISTNRITLAINRELMAVIVNGRGNEPDFDLAYRWVEYITEVDPHPKSIYSKWILDRWLANEFGPLLEDISKASYPLELFDRAKPRLPVELRDIQRHKSFADLESFVLGLDDAMLKSKRQEDRDLGDSLIEDGSATLFYNDDDIKIIIPHTQVAACYFGRNTRWCTAANTGNMFESYNRQGRLYIILFKKENVRWQFHFETAQYMDEADRQIGRQRIIESPVYRLFDWSAAVQKNSDNLRYYPKAPTAVRIAALEDDGQLALVLTHLTDAEKEAALRSYPNLVNTDKRFDKPKWRKIALGNDVDTLKDMNNPSDEEIVIALQEDGRALRHLPDARKSQDFCWMALENRHSYDVAARERYEAKYRRGNYSNPYLNKIVVPKDAIYYIPSQVLTMDMIRYYERIINSSVDLKEFVVSTTTGINKIFELIYECYHRQMADSHYSWRTDRDFQRWQRKLQELSNQRREALDNLNRPRYEPFRSRHDPVRQIERFPLEL